jgi:hypothetical protein
VVVGYDIGGSPIEIEISFGLGELKTGCCVEMSSYFYVHILCTIGQNDLDCVVLSGYLFEGVFKF